MHCSRIFVVCTLLLASSLIAMEGTDTRKSTRKRSAPQRFDNEPVAKKKKLTVKKPQQKKTVKKHSEKPVPLAEKPVPFKLKGGRYLINPYERLRHENGAIDNPIKHEQRCYLSAYGKDDANHISPKALANGLAYKEQMRAAAAFVDHAEESKKHVYPHIPVDEVLFFGFNEYEVFARDPNPTFPFNQKVKDYSRSAPENRRYLKNDGTYGYYR